MKNTQAWIWGVALAGAVALSVGIMVSESAKKEEQRTALQETRNEIGRAQRAAEERHRKIQAGEPVLLSCRACDAPVSSQAAACPSCGQPTRR